jgi:PST family polysaccharide transporter
MKRKFLNNTVFLNFLSLGTLQVINYITPFILMPYLIRMLGVGSLGNINFSQTIISYIVVFVAFGYNYTGTKNVSESSENKAFLSKILIESIIFRLFLCLIGLLLLLVLTELIEKINDVKWIILSFYGLVISQVLFPVWFYHGLQKMKYVLYLGAISKVIILSLTFFLINDESDYLLVPLINSVSGIIIGVLSVCLILYKLNIPVCFNKLNILDIIRKNYQAGNRVFLQQAYVSMYGPINVIFLGLLSNSETVGYFTIVEKLTYIPVIFFSMAGQAFYPYAVKIFNNNKIEYIHKLKYFSIFIFIFALLISISFLWLHDYIFYLVVGHHNDLGELIFYIMIFGIPFSAMGHIVTQVFVTINKQEILNKVSLAIMIVTLSVSWSVITHYDVVGLSVFIVFRQLMVMVTCLAIISFLIKRGKI